VRSTFARVRARLFFCASADRSQIGLDLDTFRSQMTSCLPQIQKEGAELQRFGVKATRSFFINGRFVAQAQKIETFRSLINEELTRAQERIDNGTPASSYYDEWVLKRGLQVAASP
jgi:hypothetical protein